MFKNMKLGLRLGLGFGVIIVLITVMALFSITQVNKISQSVDKIVNDRFPKTIAANDVIGQINVIARVLRNMIILEKKEDVIKESKRLDGASETITKLLGELDKTIKSKEGREILSRVNSARNEYLQLQKHLRDLAIEDKNEEASKLLFGDFRDSQNKYFDAVEKLIEYQTELTREEGSSAITLAESIDKTLIAISIIIILLGIIAAVVITKSIVNPINKCIDIAEKVSKGDTDVKIDVDSKDETGVLLASMDKMVDTIKKLVNDMNEMSRQHDLGETDHLIQINKFEGAYQKMASGVNEMVNGHIAVVKKALECVAEFGKGNFDAPIEKFPGKRIFINENIEAVRGNLKKVASEVGTLIEAAKNGALQTRGNVNGLLGDWQKMVKGINEILDAILDPITEAATVLEKVAARDLSVRVIGDYKGDLAKIKNALNSAVDNLDKALQQVADATEQVSSASQQISAGSQSLAQGANQQASSLEEISSSLEEMASMTKQNAENAVQAKNLASESDGNAKTGTEAMVRMSGAINRIKESSDQTAKIVKTIDEIAMQTNLLALNAAVEAARAGEAGRGFAVVAEEVRNLAQRSAQAAKNTADMISESVKNADDGVKIASEVSQSFELIATSAKKVNDLIAEIAAASQEQSQGIDQVNTAVAQMDKITQQNAANSEESASAAEELSSQSEELQGMVGQFNLSQNISGSSRVMSYNQSSHQVPITRKSGNDTLKTAKKNNKKKETSHAEELIPLDDEVLKEF